MANKSAVPEPGLGEQAAGGVPSGLAALRHPQSAGCSWGGRAYEPDAEGVVLVPIEAAPQLRAHGFAPVGAEWGNAPMKPSADVTRVAAAKGVRG